MSQANSTTNGYLSSADWTTFNSKQASGSYISALTGDVTAAGPGSAAATLAAVAIAGTSTKVTYDVKGRVTSGTSLTASDLPSHSAALITSGTLAVANGGTGLSATPTNGQIPIGNGTNYNLATLTAGTGISINNSAGAVTVSATADASSKVSKAGDTMTGSLTLPSNGLIAGTNQLVLANGNVGIGITSPGAILDVAGVSRNIQTATSMLSGTNNSPGIYQYMDSSATGHIDALANNAYTTGLQLRTYNSGTYNTGVMINNVGNVGIGTTSPGAKLEVTGTAGTDGIKFPDATLQTTASTSNINGSAATSTSFTITASNGTYQDSGLSVTLPSAGTYMLRANVRSAISNSGGALNYIVGKLYNATDGADVANSQTMLLLSDAATTNNLQATAPIDAIVTVNGSKVIKRYVFRSCSATCSTSVLYADANGISRLQYVKLSN